MPATINEGAGRVRAKEFSVGSGHVVRGAFTDTDSGTLDVGGEAVGYEPVLGVGGIEYRRRRL